MAIDFKTFNTIVSHLIASRFPILLRGRHGIGKSTLVYQLAKKQGLPVVESINCRYSIILAVD